MPYDPRSPFFSALPRLKQAGVEPVAWISTEDFLAVPHSVAGSDRFGLMPERVARLVADERGIEVPATPFDLGVLVETLWWHPSHDAIGHQWLRRTAAEAAKRLEQCDAASTPSG